MAHRSRAGFGHAEVSHLQFDALHKAECTNVFTEAAGGALIEHVSLQESLAYVRRGNTLVDWRRSRRSNRSQKLRTFPGTPEVEAP